MGPRNRRRLTIAVAALVGIGAAGAAVVLLTRSPHSGTTSRFTVTYRGPTDRRYDAQSPKLVFGMTKTQVRRLVGPPQKTVGRCWQYQVNAVYRQGSITNAHRLCFVGGRYADIQYEDNGRWNVPPAVPVFTQ